MPPIEGLHDICPSVSTLWVNRRVREPMRAAASAASVPAWPPPTTMTSNSTGNSMGTAQFYVIVPRGTSVLVCRRKVSRGTSRMLRCSIRNAKLLRGEFLVHMITSRLACGRHALAKPDEQRVVGGGVVVPRRRAHTGG